MPASLPAVRPVALGVGLQKFHMIKVIAVDLRKCCSKDDLSTAPWRFLLSFFLLPCSSLFLWQGVNLTFEGDDIVCYSFAYYVRQIKPLARDIITLAQMFSHVLYYILNFEITVLDK